MHCCLKWWGIKSWPCFNTMVLAVLGNVSLHTAFQYWKTFLGDVKWLPKFSCEEWAIKLNGSCLYSTASKKWSFWQLHYVVEPQLALLTEPLYSLCSYLTQQLFFLGKSWQGMEREGKEANGWENGGMFYLLIPVERYVCIESKKKSICSDPLWHLFLTFKTESASCFTLM